MTKRALYPPQGKDIHEQQEEREVMKTVYAYGFWFLVGTGVGAVVIKMIEVDTENRKKGEQ